MYKEIVFSREKSAKIKTYCLLKKAKFENKKCFWKIDNINCNIVKLARNKKLSSENHYLICNFLLEEAFISDLFAYFSYNFRSLSTVIGSDRHLDIRFRFGKFVGYRCDRIRHQPSESKDGGLITHA